MELIAFAKDEKDRKIAHLIDRYGALTSRGLVILLGGNVTLESEREVRDRMSEMMYRRLIWKGNTEPVAREFHGEVWVG